MKENLFTLREEKLKIFLMSILLLMKLLRKIVDSQTGELDSLKNMLMELIIKLFQHETENNMDFKFLNSKKQMLMSLWNILKKILYKN